MSVCGLNGRFRVSGGADKVGYAPAFRDNRFAAAIS